MDRRTFLSACASGLALAPAIADGQPGAKLNRVGFLLGATAESVASLFGAFNEGMRDRGYVAVRNLLKAPEDLDGAFATLVSRGVQAIVVVVGPLTYLLRKPIGDLTLKNRLPAISTLSDYAQDGLLMTYGPKLTDLYGSRCELRRQDPAVRILPTCPSSNRQDSS